MGVDRGNYLYDTYSYHGKLPLPEGKLPFHFPVVDGTSWRALSFLDFSRSLNLSRCQIRAESIRQFDST
jgi:hypothetical protein